MLRSFLAIIVGILAAMHAGNVRAQVALDALTVRIGETDFQFLEDRNWVFVWRPLPGNEDPADGRAELVEKLASDAARAQSRLVQAGDTNWARTERAPLLVVAVHP